MKASGVMIPYLLMRLHIISSIITGCDDCQQSIAGECNRHGALHIVSDSPVLSRARQSLPTVLEFRQSGEKTQGNNMSWENM